jgi:HK97 family phage prohead protease
MKTTEQLKNEFGVRAVKLNTGAIGLRAGIHCEVRDPQDGDGYEMDFIASDNTVDRYNEVIQPGAWGDMANFRANPVIPDCHDYSSIAKILGRAKSISVQNDQLVNRVAFCMDNPMGALAYKMAKGGFLKSQSVGFIPLEWTNGTGADQPDRTYTKCELLEISLVVVPANPAATVGIKSAFQAGAITHADICAAADFLKQFSSEQETEAQKRAAASALQSARALELMRSLKAVLAT